jgi:hypothetical protein
MGIICLGRGLGLDGGRLLDVSFLKKPVQWIVGLK